MSSCGRLECVLSASWERVGADLAVLGYLGPSCRRLGPSWAVLGCLGCVLWASWGVLGMSRAVLGASCGRLGSVSGQSWAVVGRLVSFSNARLWTSCGHLGRVSAHSWRVMRRPGTSWVHLGGVLGRLWGFLPALAPLGLSWGNSAVLGRHFGSHLSFTSSPLVPTSSQLVPTWLLSFHPNSVTLRGSSNVLKGSHLVASQCSS